MKKFLINSIILIFTLICFAFITNNIYDFVYLNSTPRNQFSLLVQKKQKPANYVFIGSSRVQNHINTNLVEELTGKSALNLGIQGAKMSDYELVLKLITENEYLPEKVFLQVDYIFNFKESTKIASSQAIPYIETNLTVQNHCFKYDALNTELYLKIPFYKYAVNDFKLGFREFFLNLISRKPKLELNNGFNPLYGNFPQKKASLPDQIVDSNQSFNEIKKIAKDHGIALEVFIAPFCKNTKNLNFVDKLKTKISNFSDFSRSVENQDFFQNCSHLNVKGANLFTKQLVKQLILY